MSVAPASVTFASARGDLAALTRSLASGGWALDLSACETFDSSLLGVLLELERRARAAGARCRFDNPPPNLVELARLYGARDLLFGERDAGRD